jgi:hypothetical protein
VLTNGSGPQITCWPMAAGPQITCWVLTNGSGPQIGPHFSQRFCWIAPVRRHTAHRSVADVRFWCFLHEQTTLCYKDFLNKVWDCLLKLRVMLFLSIFGAPYIMWFWKTNVIFLTFFYKWKKGLIK